MNPLPSLKRQAEASGNPLESSSDKRVLLVILLGALLVRIAPAFRVVPDGLYDDAYITLRYAANLARGWGFVFNQGEHVWGTTTPLFTLVLAALGRLFGVSHLETIAIILDVLATLGALYFTAKALRRAQVPLALESVYLISLAVLPAFVTISISGMETPLVLFLMSWSLALFQERRLGAVAVLCGLLLLLRIDALIWICVLGLHLLLGKYSGKAREFAKAVGIFLLAVLPWYVFAAFYFGTIVPQSLLGKAVSHGAFQFFDREYFSLFLNSFIPGVRSATVGWVTVPVTVVIIALGIENLWRSFPALRPLVTFLLLYSAAFLLGRAPLFEWYFVPVKWAYYFILLCGVDRVVKLPASSGRLVKKERWVLVLAGILAVAYGGWNLRRWFRPLAPNMWSQVSAFLEENTSTDARIFLEHIGLVGFKTNRYVYDSMGLVTPRTVEMKRQYGDAWLPRAVQSFGADVVVFYQQDLSTMKASPDAGLFWQKYLLVKDFRQKDLEVAVFFRKDSRLAFATEAGPQTPGHE